VPPLRTLVITWIRCRNIFDRVLSSEKCQSFDSFEFKICQMFYDRKQLQFFVLHSSELHRKIKSQAAL